MTTINWRILAASFGIAAFAAGCSNGGGTVPPIKPPSESIDFSAFVNQAFSNPANSTPVSVDVDFTFDVNDDPTAFDALILSGTY